MNLGDNFVLGRSCNRITPFTTNKPGAKNFDTEKTYNNVMFRYKYGGLSRGTFSLDETVMRMYYTHRRLFADLALRPLPSTKMTKALKVLQKSEKKIPDYKVPMNYMSGGNDIARAYALRAEGKGRSNHQCYGRTANSMSWYLALNGSRLPNQSTIVLTSNCISCKQVNEITAMVWIRIWQTNR